jgi:hypothetical protein
MIRRCPSLTITASRVAPALSGRIAFCNENNRLLAHDLRAGSPPKRPSNSHCAKALEKPSLPGKISAPPADLRRLLSDYPRSCKSVVHAPGRRLPAGLEAMVKEHRPAARACQARKIALPFKTHHPSPALPSESLVAHILRSSLFHSGANVVLCPQLSSFPSQSFSDRQRLNDRRRHWRT